jgi:arsenate reductase
MAESILRELGGERFEVMSAGTHPSRVHPLAIRVLEEKGYPTDGLRSKVTEEFLDREMDMVVTVCDDAKEECPFFPGAARYLHRSFTDPASVETADEGERLELFRKVRDEIEEWARSIFLQVRT